MTAKELPDGSWQVPLRNPIHLGTTQVVTELIMKPMSGGHIEDVPLDKAQLNFGHFLKVAGRLSAQPPVVINALKGQDLKEVMQITSGFFATFLGTGEEPSPDSPSDTTGDPQSSAPSPRPTSPSGPRPRRS